jgi:hypothetical protein
MVVPPAGGGECAIPKARFAALVETGARVPFGARMGPYAKSEQAPAREALGELKPGMLCLAERLFYGFGLWKQACASGAGLPWRVKNNTRPPAAEALPDGSWLGTVHADGSARRARRGGLRARVIECRPRGGGAPGGRHLPVTTLPDHKKHPAGVLAALRPQRREIETACDGFKTHLRGGSVVLRGKTPGLAEQEFYGFLPARYSVRELMHRAAPANDIDPDRLGFAHSAEVIKRKPPAFKEGVSPPEDAHAPTADNP